MEVLALAAALLLALVHVSAARLELRGAARSRFLSAAGGVSAAYVFIQLVPEIVEAQETIDEATTGVAAAVERHAFVLALAGLTLFYGLELVGRRAGGDGGRRAQRSRLFWIHVGSFASYNGLIGYLLADRMTTSVAELVSFTLAIGLHLLVNDYSLASHHRDAYTRGARWLLSAAVLAGWAVGFAAGLPEPFFSVLLAFLAGGIILNVLKEELPAYREGRFAAFALAAAAAAAVFALI
jgi:hypothetical protein